MSLHISEPPWASSAHSEANSSPVFLACLNTSGVVAIACRRSPWRAGCLCWHWSRGLRRDLHVLLFLAPQLHAAANFDLVSFLSGDGLFLETQCVNRSAEHLMLPSP